MSDITINSTSVVSSIIRAFNLSNTQPLSVRDNPFSGKIDQTDNRDRSLYKSALGTPVIIDVAFKSVSYTDFLANKIITTDAIKLQTVLCTISRPTSIVKTQIQGKAGSVKEYISKDDYAITINGIIPGLNGQYPQSEVTSLHGMLEAPVSIPVVSRFLNGLGIFNIVVEDYSMPQTAGGISKQEFTINAVSDEPLELQIS